MLRIAAVAAVSSALILSITGPASAADETVDVTPPVITSTGLIEGQLVGQRLVVHPTFSDDVGVVTVAASFAVGNAHGGSAATVTAKGIAMYPPFALDGTDADLTVRAIDAAGNIGEATTRVHVDTTAPTIALDPPSNVRLHGVVTLAITAASPDIVRITTGAQDAVQTSETSWELLWDTSSRKGPGTELVLILTDRAGNISYFRRSYPVDNAGPTISEITKVVAGGPGKLSAYVTDQAGVDRVEWWIDGVLSATGTHDFGTTSRTVPVTVKAWDGLGNASESSAQVRVDADKPVVTWVSPVNGALVRGSRIATTIRASDPTGLSVNFVEGYLTKEPVYGATNVTASGYRYANGDGRRVLTWRVTDRVGNSTTVSRAVTVDNTRAKLTITKAPKNKAKVKGTVKVKATATDKNGVAKVQLLVNGKVVATDAKAGYAFSINTRKYGKKIKIQLRAYDRAGNVTVTSARTWYR